MNINAANAISHANPKTPTITRTARLFAIAETNSGKNGNAAVKRVGDGVSEMRVFYKCSKLVAPFAPRGVSTKARCPKRFRVGGFFLMQSVLRRRIGKCSFEP